MLVRDAMTYRAEAIGPNETLQAAARRMKELGVGALVVCDEGRVLESSRTATSSCAARPRALLPPTPTFAAR
jgi:CBS domain-containing protein